MHLILRASIIVLITSLASAQQQLPQPVLRGKVARSVVRGPVGPIRITVKDRETGQKIEGEQTTTSGEDWFHVARLNALVDVEFDGGGCYLGGGHTAYRVRSVNDDFPKVILQLTRDCRFAEQRQKRGNARTSNIARRGSDDDERPVEIVSGPARGAETVSNAINTFNSADRDAVPTLDELKQELEEDATRARNGEFYDTLQYKFALKQELYHDHPELDKALTDFAHDDKNQDLFRAIGQTRPEMFGDVVRREFQLSQQINLGNILAVVKEDSISQVLRGSATVALLNGELPNEILAQAREYYRQQTPESPIFETSLIARGRIGEPEDQTALYEYVISGTTQVRRSAMEALSLATTIEGPEVFKDGAKTLATVATNDDDASLRAHAFQSLRPFVYYRDGDAVRALFAGSRDQDPSVRLQVALAFGVGNTEQQPKVRNLLYKLAETDPSLQVRKAAKLSLSGATTMGWKPPTASIIK